MHRSRRAAILLSFVLLGAVALLLPRPQWLSRGNGTRWALANAVGSDLPFDARLSGGFRPSKGRMVSRSDVDTAPTLTPDTRIAIAQLEKRFATDSTPQALADLGVAYLVQGDVDRSIAALSDAASQRQSPAPLSDLSAAYLVKAERMPARRIEYLSRALEAAAQSIRIAATNDARFNRALALDGLAAFVGEAAPWTDYLGNEPDPQWQEAARAHLADTHSAMDARDGWDARQRELRTRLANGDRTFVGETVRLYPEAAREFLERETFVDWGKAVEANEPRRRQSALAEARLLAQAIGSFTGDVMPSEELGLMQSSASSLARAHIAYAAGIQEYDANDYPGARASFAKAQAEFSLAKSPYRAWADAQLATLQFQQRNLDAADSALAAVEDAARAGEYSTLLGRTLWLRGLVYSKQWRLAEALTAFREAASRFEASNQTEYAVSLYHHLADALRALGEQRGSWEYIGKTLQGLPRVRKPVSRYLFLYNASLFASSQGLMEAALLFQDATVREASQAAFEVEVDAITQRAVVHLRRGDRARALADLSTVTGRLGRIAEGPVKAYLVAEIEVLNAQLKEGDAAAVTELRSAIGFFERAEPARVPRLYLALAKAEIAARSESATERALDDGIARLERQQTRLDDESLRISYFDDSWALFQEMVAFQLSARRDPARAFEYAERSRARSLLASAEGSNAPQTRALEQIRALLPPSVVLTYYATMADRLLLWTITASDSRLVERRVPAQELARLVAQHRASIVDRRADPSSNDRLYDVLIRPVADRMTPNATLVFAPDGDLQQLPFATLRNPATGRYLVEDHTIVMTPSASFFVASLARLRQQTAAEVTSALLVGNPDSSNARLPGAEAEVGAAARLYARHDVLIGAQASKERFVRTAPDYDVVHFGGHAFTNPEYPELSRLSFASDDGGEGQSLFAHEIARMHFTNTRLVVLAACSTAVGAVSRGEGAISVARPFLGAGVPLVIASQWDVDDRATEEMFLTFHRELLATHDPVIALRSAQLALLRGGNKTYALPASWGAFVALGTTAH